jgi:pheromone shutdown protein TraB
MVTDGPGDTDAGLGPDDNLDSIVVGDVRPPETPTAGTVTVVGTTRDAESPDGVRSTIERVRPDVVALDLDDRRYDELVDEGDTELDTGDVASGTAARQMLGQWLLTDATARFRERADVDRDANAVAAIEAADRHDADVALVDRPLETTVGRLWDGLSVRERTAIWADLATGVGGPLRLGLGLGLFLGLLIGATVRLAREPIFLPPAGPIVSIVDALVLVVVLGVALGAPLAAVLALAGRRVDDVTPDSDHDAITAMLEARSASPADAETLLDERDAFLVRRLLALRDAGYDVVATVAAGRRPAVERYLDTPSALPSEATPGDSAKSGRLRSLAYRTVGYAFTLGFLSLFVLLALGGAQNWFVLQLFGAWFAVNFVAAAGVARLAGAHWTSASAGGAVAWLTSVNPFITPGLFIAYVELRYTTVSLSDVALIKEVISNRERSLRARVRRLHADVGLFRLLAIMTVANLASFLASVLFVVAVLPYLAADVGGLDGIGNLLVEGMREGARLLGA